jgi:hypothetical protein
MSRLLQIVFFFEVGFVLALVPWSSYWDRNYFADTLPWLRAITTNDFVRGGVTGLGLVNLAAGAMELFSIFVARRDEEPILSIGRTSAED